MSAELFTEIKLKGNKEELKKAIDTIKSNKYLSNPSINQKFLDTITINELEAIIEQSNVTIKANGPYGRFKTILEPHINETLACAVPTMSFETHTSGRTTSANVELFGRLENEKLYQKYIESIEDNNAYMKYSNYISKELPLEKFCEIFNLNIEDIDEDNYIDFFTEEYSEYAEYETFTEYFEESNITKKEFEKSLKYIIDLNIKDFLKFNEELINETCKEWEFDPYKKIPKVQKPEEIYAREISEKPDKIEFEQKIFVLTCCDYDWIKNYITEKGGIIKNSITLKTNYLIIGDYISSKTQKIINAQEYNQNKGTTIQAITLDEFKTIIDERRQK